MVIAPRLPSLSASLQDTILNGHYVDLAELPPAKGNVRSLSGDLEGKTQLVRSTDLLEAKNSFQTWELGHMLYFAVVISCQSEPCPL